MAGAPLLSDVIPPPLPLDEAEGDGVSSANAGGSDDDVDEEEDVCAPLLAAKPTCGKENMTFDCL